MAVDYFLKIDGVQGSSTDAVHKDEIMMDDWSFGETQTGTAALGVGGSGAGRVSMQEFRFTKKSDKAGPLLFKLCANGQHIKNAIFTARRAGAKSGKQEEVLKVVFEELIISNFETHGSGGDEIPRESVAFSFSKVTFGYREIKDGTPQGNYFGGYDLKQNKKYTGPVSWA